MRRMYYDNRLIRYEERLDLLDMIASSISEIEEPDDIRAVINGLRFYYQQKYMIAKEESDKAMEEFKKSVQRQEPASVILPEEK